MRTTCESTFATVEVETWPLELLTDVFPPRGPGEAHDEDVRVPEHSRSETDEAVGRGDGD